MSNGRKFTQQTVGFERVGEIVIISWVFIKITSAQKDYIGFVVGRKLSIFEPSPTSRSEQTFSIYTTQNLQTDTLIKYQDIAPLSFSNLYVNNWE